MRVFNEFKILTLRTTRIKNEKAMRKRIAEVTKPERTIKMTETMKITITIKTRITRTTRVVTIVKLIERKVIVLGERRRTYEVEKVKVGKVERIVEMMRIVN